jgi:hypothetical protein
MTEISWTFASRLDPLSTRLPYRRPTADKSYQKRRESGEPCTLAVTITDLKYLFEHSRGGHPVPGTSLNA